MFASKSIAVHLVRGFLGLGALGGAMALLSQHPLVALALFVTGLVALRGCPMCWTLGLFETVRAKLSGRAVDGTCFDGSCATSSPKPP